MSDEREAQLAQLAQLAEATASLTRLYVSFDGRLRLLEGTAPAGPPPPETDEATFLLHTANPCCGDARIRARRMPWGHELVCLGCGTRWELRRIE